MFTKKFITFGVKEVSEFFFNSVINRDYINKPFGGFWSSEYLPNSLYKSDWEMWCREQNFNLEKLNEGIIFELEDYANIFVVDSYEDLLELSKKYSYEKEGFKIISRKLIDFEKMSKDYDGLFLTERGESQTRYTSKVNFYGWDCSSLLLFNIDVIKNQEKYFEK